MVFFPTGHRSSQRKMLDEADTVVKIMKDVNFIAGMNRGAAEEGDRPCIES